jgi:hypothetical protein
MTKQLFFTAALLLPGLAYSGNPSAELSVQMVPTGSDPAHGGQAVSRRRIPLCKRWLTCV